MNTETYWIVWCEGGGSPTVKHADWRVAERRRRVSVLRGLLMRLGERRA